MLVIFKACGIRAAISSFDSSILRELVKVSWSLSTLSFTSSASALALPAAACNLLISSGVMLCVLVILSSPVSFIL